MAGSDGENPPLPPETAVRLPETPAPSGRAARWLLARYPVGPLIAFLAEKKVPRHRQSVWYMTGGIALFFLLVQIVTGMLLMVYYRPDRPWGSVQQLVNEVPFGNVVRSLHHWGANLMILALFAHLFSNFFFKAYRPPRELTWLSGLGLLGLTFLLCFSGYLLPWDRLAFFATRVGTSYLEALPFLGRPLAGLLRGGDDVGPETLGRCYALHVTVVPLVLLGLLGLHLLFIQVQGISEPDGFRALPAEQQRYTSFFGEYLFTELAVWLLLAALLVALAALLPRALGPEAEPAAPAPEGIKPEWYFLAPYQALKLFPGRLELLGMFLLGALPLAAAALPVLDRAVPADRRGRLVRGLGALALAALVALTAWGWLA